MSEINCTEAGCDTSRLTTDWELSDEAYVIDAQTRYVLSAPSSAVMAPFKPLHYSETEFIARFRQPTTYEAPNGEVWRLYSQATNVSNKKFEIIVGYAEKAPWKMIDSPQSLIGIVDPRLKREAEKIAAGLQTGRADFHGVRADGFEVVNAETQQVVDWGPYLPILLPKDAHLPAPGSRPYFYDGHLYLVQTDTDGRLYAISLVSVGAFRWLAILAGFAFLSTTAIARSLSRRFLRDYFALRGVRTPTLEEAVRQGEGQNVEFKRGLFDANAKASKSADELAESIAAFANTNDGVIFLGVDDNGHVKGLPLDFKQKDRLEQKIHQLVRNHIKPIPPMQVAFEDLRGLLIAKITIARGDAPVYMMNGRIYIRSGSSDVPAQPEDMERLVAEYAP